MALTLKQKMESEKMISHYGYVVVAKRHLQSTSEVDKKSGISGNTDPFQIQQKLMACLCRPRNCQKARDSLG